MSTGKVFHCKKSSDWCPLHAGLLIAILFTSEDGGNVFLKNFGRLSQDYINKRNRKIRVLVLFYGVRAPFISKYDAEIALTFLELREMICYSQFEPNTKINQQRLVV
jgi:hypothetical protein